MTTNLGTLGTVTDLSRAYAPGSFECWVTFQAEGLTFKAHHFVRTDAHMPVDNVHLYIAHESSWMTDYVKTFTAATATSRVDRRALHLLAVAEAASHEGIAERYAQIELA